MTNKTQHTKKALIEAMHKSLGIVTKACEMVGVNRSTYYDYYNKDKEFREKIDELSDVAIDFVESKLFERVEKGSDTAIIFYLKTKAKHRGYIERVETKDVTNDYSDMSPEQHQKELEKVNKEINKILKDK